MDKFYCVSAISLTKITEEKLKEMYEIHKIKYKKEISFEHFLKFQKDFKEDKYLIDSFVSSYHSEKEKAIQYAVNNIGDINEAGCYNYAGVSTLYTDIAYYNTEQNPKEDFIIYKYCREDNMYHELDKSAPEYKYILSHLWGFVSSEPIEENK